MTRSLRQIQKETTRARIMTCAEELFLNKNYGSTTVEQIAGSAKISRMTFYQHFADKEAVLRAVIADYGMRAVQQMRTLSGPDPDRRTIRAWLDDFVRFVTSEMSAVLLINEVSITSGEPPAYVRDVLDRIVSALGEGLPAFRAGRSEGALALEARARANLTIVQLFWAGQIAASYESEEYSGAALDVVAEAIHAFTSDPRFVSAAIAADVTPPESVN